MKTVISSDFLSGPGFALGKAADRNTALRKVNTATAAALIMCIFVLTSQICRLSDNHATLVFVVISRLKTEPSIICITSNDTTTAPVSGAFSVSTFGNPHFILYLSSLHADSALILLPNHV